MATEYTGNAIPAPGLATGASTSNDELLYSANNYIQKGITLKPGQGVLLLGTLLKQDTATKKYVKATLAGDAQGILRHTVDTGADANAQGWLGNILYSGLVKLAKVQAANSGVTIDNTVLNGTANAVAGFFKF